MAYGLAGRLENPGPPKAIHCLVVSKGIWEPREPGVDTACACVSLGFQPVMPGVVIGPSGSVVSLSLLIDSTEELA